MMSYLHIRTGYINNYAIIVDLSFFGQMMIFMSTVREHLAVGYLTRDVLLCNYHARQVERRER